MWVSGGQLNLNLIKWIDDFSRCPFQLDQSVAAWIVRAARVRQSGAPGGPPSGADGHRHAIQLHAHRRRRTGRHAHHQRMARTGNVATNSLSCGQLTQSTSFFPDKIFKFCRLVAALDGRDDDVEPGRLWRFAEPQVAFGRIVETGYCGLQQVRSPAGCENTAPNLNLNWKRTRQNATFFHRIAVFD